MSFAARLDDLVRPIAPAERLAAVRLLVGTFALIYLLVRLGSFASVATHDAGDFAPAGPARLLSGPIPAWGVYGAVALTLAFGVTFLVGWRFKITGPLYAASLISVLAYRNSFGMIFHTENLMVMHVAILALSDSAAAYSLDAKREGATPEPARRYGFALQWLGVVTAVAYVLAGVAKLRVSGLGWAGGEILRNHIVYDNLRKHLLGDSFSPLGAWTARHTWLFPPLAVLTLIFELGAPIALLRGRIAKAWALVAWSFHVGVLALMWILFPYQLFFIAFASFFEPEKLVERVRAWRRART
ncbi:MAG: hypothetical protein IPM79_36495 [Polyangiaceae bacterium]|nr:hypothetical protein [Polyangiaceae bacterium]